MARPVADECQKCGRKKPPGECSFCRQKRQKVYRQSESGRRSERAASKKYQLKMRDCWKLCAAAGIKTPEELHQILTRAMEGRLA